MSLRIITGRRSPSSGSLPGTLPSRPSSGSGPSTGRGGSSWSRRTRWSRSTGKGNGLSRDRRSRTWPGLLSGRGDRLPLHNPSTPRLATEPVKGPVVPCFPLPPFSLRERFPKTRNPGRNTWQFSGGNQGGHV